MKSFSRTRAWAAAAALASFFALTLPAFAALEVEFDSSVPEISPRDNSFPPQPGVQLFVFPGEELDQQYAMVFNVNEEPASVVLIAADMVSYDYDANAGTVTIVLDHVGYVPGISAPGPETDFSIAFLTAVADGAMGPPAAMRGSWMATNIGPNDWELIPPDMESPAFGYRLSGPEGEAGFFTMYIPQTLIEMMSAVYGEPLTVADLAVFNDDLQASLDITSVKNEGVVLGALIDINVVFTSGSTEFLYDDDDDEDDETIESVRAAFDYPEYPGGGSGALVVNKSITVDRAQQVSLSASNITPVKGSSVTIYGWARDGVEGQKVKITSANALKRAMKRGPAALAKYRKRGWKMLSLDSEGYFSHSFVVKKNDTLQAIYKQAGKKAQKSTRLKIKALAQ